MANFFGIKHFSIMKSDRVIIFVFEIQIKNYYYVTFHLAKIFYNIKHLIKYRQNFFMTKNRARKKKKLKLFFNIKKFFFLYF